MHRAALAAALVLASCGGDARGSAGPGTPDRTAAGDADLRALLLDSVTSGALCRRVTDRFIGLPDEGGPSGAAAGRTPQNGRWWIRRCSAEQRGAQVALSLAGPGWFWIDRREAGFRVQQVVYFSVSAELTGAVDIGYDPGSKLVSLWFTPTSEAAVTVEPTGEVNPRAETVWAWLLDVGTLGELPSAQARARVAAEGARQFRERLGSGVTVTLGVDSRQMDLLLGQLPRGVAPERPFEGSRPWLVNERQRLERGAVQVSGPIEGSVIADFRVERGGPVELVGVCARDLHRALDAVGSGKRPRIAASAVFARRTVSGSGTARFRAPGCPWYLTSSTRQSAVAAIRLRSWGRRSEASPQAAVIRLTLLSYEVFSRNPDGDGWDVAGGAPDVRIRARACGGAPRARRSRRHVLLERRGRGSGASRGDPREPVSPGRDRCGRRFGRPDRQRDVRPSPTWRREERSSGA